MIDGDTTQNFHSDQVGQRLRDLRGEREWSLDRTAGVCGVSKAMLGQIERGESSPTITTLWKIASGFRVPGVVVLFSRCAA